MRNHQTGRRSQLILAFVVVCVFIAVAFIGPIFFSQPEQAYPQLLVASLAYLIFATLGGFQLGSRRGMSGWIILLVFIVGYVALFALRDQEFYPDQHWFVMSPLGYVTGALAFGIPDMGQTAKSSRSHLNGLEVQCWSSAGLINQPVDDIAGLIERLDGDALSLIRLIHQTRCLEIGGGTDGRFVAYYSNDYRNDDAWIVRTTPTAQDRSELGEQPMYIADIRGYIGEHLWCSAGQVQRMVQEFAEQGHIDTSNGTGWVNDGPMAGGLRPSLPRGS